MNWMRPVSIKLTWTGTVLFRRHNQQDFVMESVAVSERGGDVKDGPQFSDLFYSVYSIHWSYQSCGEGCVDTLSFCGNVKMLTPRLWSWICGSSAQKRCLGQVFPWRRRGREG